MAEKLYYKINEVAQMFSITAPTLRYWEREFEQLSPVLVNNQRRYTEADIEIVRKIYDLLRVQGVRINLAKGLLASDKSYSKKKTPLDRLEALRLELDCIIEDLKREKLQIE